MIYHLDAATTPQGAAWRHHAAPVGSSRRLCRFVSATTNRRRSLTRIEPTGARGRPFEMVATGDGLAGSARDERRRAYGMNNKAAVPQNTEAQSLVLTAALCAMTCRCAMPQSQALPASCNKSCMALFVRPSRQQFQRCHTTGSCKQPEPVRVERASKGKQTHRAMAAQDMG